LFSLFRKEGPLSRG